MASQSLCLKKLKFDSRPGLTPCVGESMAEAASVCLDSQKHTNNVIIVVKGDFTNDYFINVLKVTDQMRRSHNDEQVATETGAYGIAILIIELNTNYTVVERSRKGTGFDFWLGDKDRPAAYFQNKARLEVSGIRHGSESDIRTRVKSKSNQIDRSNQSLRGYVVVVEFRTPQARVVEK